MSDLPKAARIERELAKHVPSATDVQLERVKAELLALLRQQAPERLKKRQRWLWLLVAGVFTVVAIVVPAVTRGIRGLD